MGLSENARRCAWLTAVCSARDAIYFGRTQKSAWTDLPPFETPAAPKLRMKGWSDLYDLGRERFGRRLKKVEPHFIVGARHNSKAVVVIQKIKRGTGFRRGDYYSIPERLWPAVSRRIKSNIAPSSKPRPCKKRICRARSAGSRGSSPNLRRHASSTAT